MDYQAFGRRHRSVVHRKDQRRLGAEPIREGAVSLGGSQRSTSSDSTSCSQPKQREAHDKTNQRSPSIATPCKQIAALRLNSEANPSCTKNKQQKKKFKKSKLKLMSSKSLSQLIPMKFLMGAAKETEDKGQGAAPLQTTRSFPNGAFQFDCELPQPQQQKQSQQSGNSPSMSDSQQTHHSTDLSIRQVQSLSLLGMPRQSTCNPLLGLSSASNASSSCATLASTSNLSPIVSGRNGTQNEMMRGVVASTPTIKPRTSRLANRGMVSRDENEGQEEERKEVGKLTGQCDEGEDVKQERNKPRNKFKSLKSTALVLRDVKNSLGLRMRARHESKAFARFDNELASPPVKLYSPFNIYTPNCSMVIEEDSGELCESVERASKNKRPSKCKSRGKKQADRVEDNDSGFMGSVSLTSGPGDESVAPQTRARNENNHYKDNAKTTAKGRIALRHKKHLMQTNTFAAFESPAGRLRETVKDVEQFQQCIEDISLAIRTRGGSGGGGAQAGDSGGQLI